VRIISASALSPVTVLRPVLTAANSSNRVRATPQVVEIGRGEGEIDHVAGSQIAPHQHQPLRIPIGQRLQKHGVDHAENGGARADSQSDGDDGGQGEGGALADRPARASDRWWDCRPENGPIMEHA